MIVVDANIVAYYFIQGARTEEAQRLRSFDAVWIVPPLWSVELQSILWKHVRAKGMSPVQALAVLEHALVLLGPNEQAASPRAALSEAIHSGITPYDAQYIALARQSGIPCVTEDLDLLSKCPGTAVSMDSLLGRRPDLLREDRGTYTGGKRAGARGSRRSRPL